MKTKTKRTKIVVTLGPATSTVDSIKELISSGANMVRINTSHASMEEHEQTINNVRKAAEELKAFVPILVDLQGPKIRVGKLLNEVCLCVDDIITLSPSESDFENNVFPVDYDGIANDVNMGSIILIDDGKIQLEVLETIGQNVRAKVINAGVLKSRKGINIPGTTASLCAVTERDVEFIKFAVEMKADYIALSFVRDAGDIILAKKYIDDFDGEIPVIAKIEKPQAVENIESIVRIADGVMIARGDLGIEISPEKVPIVQKKIIKLANKFSKVVIVATQMLETMIEQPIPTRAEASDVANAIIDTADAVMLSGETSVGNFAQGAVSMMTSIAYDVEHSDFCPYNVHSEINDEYELTPQAIVASAVKLAYDVHAKMILSFTHTGYSTRFLSKLRPQMPIMVISDSKKSCRKLNLYWNLFPYYKDWDRPFNQSLLDDLDKFLKTKTDLVAGDRIIITGSLPMLISGRTNFLRVHKIS